jgi:uncharacterized protein (TIGR03086 family)
MTTPTERTSVLDFEPATRELAQLVAGVRDDQLADPTPCADTSVAALLDHVAGLGLAFTAAARKDVPPGGSTPPVADAANLVPDWREVIPQRLESLARAWQVEDAWTGETEVGGVRLPAPACAMFALDELVVHAWDIATATGRSLDPHPELLAANLEFVRAATAEHPDGTPGLFGPRIVLPDGAAPLDQLVALTGRSPSWPA